MIQEKTKQIWLQAQRDAEWFYWLFTYKEGNKYVGMRRATIPGSKRTSVRILAPPAFGHVARAGSLLLALGHLPGAVSFMPFWGL